jgi:YidC/Oxa1 family membrane protein insertase
MKPETRTIVAIFLIVLISIVSYRFLPRQEAPPEVPSAEEETLSTLPAEVDEPEPAEIEEAPVRFSEEEDSVSIETDLLRVSLSTVGASISSLVLKEYKDLTKKNGEEAPDAELIPRGRRALTSSVRTKDTTYALGLVNFTLEKVVPVSETTDAEVTFSALLPDGNYLRRTYTFGESAYVIGLRDVCSGSPRELRVDWRAGLRQTEKAQRGYLNYFSAMAMVGGLYKQWPLPKAVKILRDADAMKIRDLEYVGRVDWGAVKTKYFLACLIPRKEVRYFRVDTIPYAEEEGSSNLSVTLGTEGGMAEYDIYIGPLQYDRLRSFGLGLERAVYLGPGWVSGISRLILRVLVWLHRVVHNYGVVIIIFSCIMMIVFYPLTFRSLRSMREMQKLQPKINALREKYKNDSQKLNAEMIGIYRKEGINPLGGCLPLLFQMPVFWALFAILRSMIELRGAQFLWITDLSERDPYFILPVLMAGSMYIQQRFTPTDPRQKAMAVMMPLVMLFIFWSFPAGLVLYWLVYNVLSVVQHYLLHRRKEESKEAPA